MGHISQQEEEEGKDGQTWEINTVEDKNIFRSMEKLVYNISQHCTSFKFKTQSKQVLNQESNTENDLDDSRKGNNSYHCFLLMSKYILKVFFFKL